MRLQSFVSGKAEWEVCIPGSNCGEMSAQHFILSSCLDAVEQRTVQLLFCRANTKSENLPPLLLPVLALSPLVMVAADDGRKCRLC